MGSVLLYIYEAIWEWVRNGIYDIPAKYLNVFIRPKINDGVDDYSMWVALHSVEK